MSTYHHGNLRSALLSEALAQVRERGAEKVSLRALAGAVGVSPSAVYQHFGDKDALLAGVGDVGYSLLAEGMTGAVVAVTGDDDEAAVDRLVAAGSAYVAFATTEPHLFRLMFGPLCPPPEEISAGHPCTAGDGDTPCTKHATFAVMQQRVDEIAARGLLRLPSDQALHLTLWSVVHGFSVLAIETHLQVEVGTQVLEVLRRLVLSDP